MYFLSLPKFNNNNSILNIKKNMIHVFIVVYRNKSIYIHWLTSILLGELFCLYKTVTPVAPVSR